MAPSKKSPQVALDTNFILDLAEGDEDCLDCIEELRRVTLAPKLVLTPTVVEELVHLAKFGEEKESQELANIALSSILKWGLQPINFIAVGHGIVDRVSEEIRVKNLLPWEERHDALIIAEAALCNCDILVTSDQQITGIPHEQLKPLLEGFHISCPLICWPKMLIKLLSKKA